ncbi:AraC family transcriptional regulator [Pedobacter nyackensis]|uniref:AraC family transcriptional regulator n=1 Tax=Pedobacter nyackensis TaxID=475255 RepID=UPI00293112B7|nr:AraC family transcriptional regulator [Pedobacter nyackensis]
MKDIRRTTNLYIRKTPFRNALYINGIGNSPNAQFHSHVQERGCPDYILIYCVDGKGYCQTQKNNFAVLANQFILLPRAQFCSYQNDIENPSTIYWVHFSGSMINELKADFDLEKYEVPTSLTYNEQILELWQEMYSSLMDGYTNENVGYASLCLYRFFSFFIFPNRANKSIKEARSKDRFVQSISYMKANVHKRLTTDEIAELFNYSSAHFSVLFKQRTGLSPIDYFIKIKIRHACTLLTESNLIIKEIAEKVGYEDPFYFSRIFKKVTGNSPLEYKRNHDIGMKMEVPEIELAC